MELVEVSTVRAYLEQLNDDLQPGGTPASEWDRFYAACSRRIRDTLFRHRLTDAEREDCSQEVWQEIVATRLSRFGSGCVLAWVSRLARNKAIDALRRRARWTTVGPDPLPDAAAACCDDSATMAEATARSRALVWRTLDELEPLVPVAHFLAFYLHWMEGWSFREVGGVLGASEAQARLRAFRVKQKFAGLLREQPRP